MSFLNTDSEVRYLPTGQTLFDITFPFLDSAHIYLAVSAGGVEAPALISSSRYTVTRRENGMGVLETKDVYNVPSKLVIFREVPLTQPTSFEVAGPFPAKNSELALDRIVMMVQQLARRVAALAEDDDEGAPSVGGGGQGSANWLDAAERATTRPLHAGQLGVERATQTVWIGQSTTVGDWVEFRPIRKARISLAFLSDAGQPSSYQTAAAARLDDWEPDAVLFGGGGNYSPPDGVYEGVPNYDADWAAFASWISAGKAFPALGSVDVDSEGWEERHAQKFPYLPGNRRYYKVSLGGGLVDVFVIHSGFDSSRAVIEPDGNEVGSVQHQWFAAQLAASQARWKIAVFHRPAATIDNEPGLAAVELDWPEFAGVDLVCCGSSRLLEILSWRDTMLVNASAVVFDDGEAGAVLQGGVRPVDSPLWVDESTRGLARIVATNERLEVQMWSLSGQRLHSRDARDFNLAPPITEQFGVIDSTKSVGAFTNRYVGSLVESTKIKRVLVMVGEAGSQPFTWTLHAGAVLVASGELEEETTASIELSEIPDSMIPQGTQLWLSVAAVVGHTAPDALGLRIAIFAERYAGASIGSVVSLPGPSLPGGIVTNNEDGQASKHGRTAIGNNVNFVDVVFTTPFAAAPRIPSLPTVEKGSGSDDNISVLSLSGISTTGFRAHLSADTPNANYHLQWSALKTP